MKDLINSLILIIAVAFTSCSPVKVITDQDKSADFSSYKTYHFLGWQDDSDKIINDLDKKRIHDSFKKEFEARGMKLVESDGDMAVSLFIVVDEKTSTTAHTDYYSTRYRAYHPYRRGWNQGYATTTYTQNDYMEGTIVLDVFDGQSKDQIWQGVARSTINENPGSREKAIPKKIASLMKKFPVPKTDK
jgi:hypothetical protein